MTLNASHYGPNEEAESELDWVQTAPIDQLLLGEITGWDLPHPLLSVYLRGLFEGEATVERLRAELRRLDATDAAPAARDIAGLLAPQFAELSRRRNDQKAAAYAERRARVNQDFGQGVA